MAINPIQFPQTTLNNRLDLSSLDDLGKAIKDARDQSEAEKLIAGLLNSSGTSQGPTSLQTPLRSLATLAAPAVTPAATPAATPVTAPAPVAASAPLAPPAPAGYFRPTQLGDASWAPGQPTTAPPAGPNVPPVFGPAPAAPVAPPPAAVASAAPGNNGSVFGPQQPPPAFTLPPQAAGAFPAALPGAPDASVAQGVPLPVPRPAGADGLPQAVADARAEAPAQTYSPQGLDRALAVIRQKESSGDYGNVTTSRTRSGKVQQALGAYGVMDFNVGPWTEEALGQRLTPQQFLASREAQDAVARAKLGQYASKYGLTGAAKAWFAGEGGMNNPNARDALGTTTSAYANDFERKMGGNLPPEITGGRSRPAADTGEPQQKMAFDDVHNAVKDNLTSGQPAQAAGVTNEQIAALYHNPLTRPLALGFLQKRLDPGSYDFMAVGDSLVRYNKTKGTYDVIPTSQKPMVVGKKIYDPNTKTFQSSTDEAYPDDPPVNYRWADPNNKAAGVVPIKGGPGEKIESEVGARLGLAKSFMDQLPSIQKRIDAGEAGLDNPVNHTMAALGVGAPGELRRQIDSGADALQRMLTGAGMPESEAANYVRRYTFDRTRDTAASLKSKTNQLARELTYIGDVIGKGRGGNIVVGKDGLEEKNAAPRDAAPPDEVRSIGGKTYHRVGQKWFEQ
jgi:hypothetical protein